MMLNKLLYISKCEMNSCSGIEETTVHLTVEHEVFIVSFNIAVHILHNTHIWVTVHTLKDGAGGQNLSTHPC